MTKNNLVSETPSEAVAHEIMLHFPGADWDQALAAGESALLRMQRPAYEYALREDWAFDGGHERTMPCGSALDVADVLAALLSNQTGTKHTVIRRLSGEQSWHEWKRPAASEFVPADLDALDAANHAADLRNERHDGSWRDRD